MAGVSGFELFPLISLIRIGEGVANGLQVETFSLCENKESARKSVSVCHDRHIAWERFE